MLRKILQRFTQRNTDQNSIRYSIQTGQSTKKIPIKRTIMLSFTAFLVLLGIRRKLSNQLEFLMHNTPLNKKIIQQNKQLNEETFKPSLYLPLGILQQMYSKYLQPQIFIKQTQGHIDNYTIHYMPKLEGQREKVKAKYTKQSKVKKEEEEEGNSYVIVVGGSEGFNELMKNIMVLACSNKLQTIGLNADDFHDSGKLRRIIQNIKEQNKGNKFYGIGIQYGANLMVIAAAQDPTLFDCMVSVGNPLDLIEAERKVQNSFAAKKTFLQNIIHGRLHKSNQQYQISSSQLTLYSLDQQIYKLKDDEVIEFKKKHSSINYLQKLKTPTIFLNSKQDPLTPSLENDERIQSNPLLTFILTKHGGHNEWFYTLKSLRWGPKFAVTHLRNFQRINKTNPQLIRQAKQGVTQ